uniref:endo-1,4-beta-xylanase n=1 Tax=Hyaloperonospora arabidopsidis (strain Emoy2) TaxID=559515 RepID=M4BCI2_HYAAE
MKLYLHLITASLSLATVQCALVPSTYTGSKGLHELAKEHGKYTGTATDNGELTDKFYVEALQDVSEFGMITPGNAMKWDATEPTQNTFTYTKADEIVALAKKSGAQIRCHTLLWHSQVPSWVQSLSKTEMLSALENHITKVMTHFGDTCYAWDVANEVMGDDAVYRKSFWYKATGTDYIVTAFKTANAVKKSLKLKTKLYYNDYNTNTINAKSTAVLDMIQKLLLDADIGIDGMGFQSHSSFSDTSSTEDLVANLERFSALGLDVAYTELDVKTSSPTPPPEEEEKQVVVYTNTIAACRKVKKCVGVTIWDFADQYTWLKDSAPLPWYQPAGKGTKLVRKRAYDGIAAGWGASASSNSSTPSSAAGESETESPSKEDEGSLDDETLTAEKSDAEAPDSGEDAEDLTVSSSSKTTSSSLSDDDAGKTSTSSQSDSVTEDLSSVVPTNAAENESSTQPALTEKGAACIRRLRK